MKKGVFVTGNLFLIFLMIFLEITLKPSYWIKSLCKILLFLVPILLYSLWTKKDWKEVIGFHKLEKPASLFLPALFFYLIILAGYFLFQDRIDLSAIRASLLEKEHVTRENFLFVFSYITVCNSFLEEAYFCGFLYEQMKQAGKTKAMLFSAFCFALYHTGIILTWFQPLIFLLAMLGLMAAGILLILVKNRYRSLKAGWLLHAMSNLAINTIGVLLLFQ